jgi:hypothetical protein
MKEGEDNHMWMRLMQWQSEEYQKKWNYKTHQLLLSLKMEPIARVIGPYNAHIMVLQLEDCMDHLDVLPPHFD